MKTSKKKIIVIALIVILVLAIAAAVFVGINSSRKPDKNASNLAKAMQIGKKDEAAVLAILKNCGVGEIVTAVAYRFGDEQNVYALSDAETAKYADSDRQIYVYT